MARFNRTVPAPKVKGPYTAFRQYVRKDFEQCCAYCFLHEFRAHGEKNFQLDHYHPKDKFPHLKRDFYNLYWACSVCNGIRSKYNHWPEPALLAKGICFVDFCKDDFADHYEILTDGTLHALTDSAAYTIEKVDLNSTHLKKVRAKILRDREKLDQEPL